MQRNADLLRKIADVIERNPDRYYQGSWESFYGETEDGTTVLDGLYHRTPDEAVEFVTEMAAPEATCGTTFCIAGWAVALTATKAEHREASRRCVYEDSYGKHFDYGAHDVRLRDVVAERVGVYGASWADLGRHLLGLDRSEVSLFDGEWRPATWGSSDSHELTAKQVAEALRALADGASLTEISYRDYDQL